MDKFLSAFLTDLFMFLLVSLMFFFIGYFGYGALIRYEKKKYIEDKELNG